jgi:hypothetical protein
MKDGANSIQPGFSLIGHKDRRRKKTYKSTVLAKCTICAVSTERWFPAMIDCDCPIKEEKKNRVKQMMISSRLYL